jgi:hypothetical protein
MSMTLAPERFNASAGGFRLSWLAIGFAFLSAALWFYAAVMRVPIPELRMSGRQSRLWRRTRSPAVDGEHIRKHRTRRKHELSFAALVAREQRRLLRPGALHGDRARAAIAAHDVLDGAEELVTSRRELVDGVGLQERNCPG